MNLGIMNDISIIPNVTFIINQRNKTLYRKLNLQKV